MHTSRRGDGRNSEVKLSTSSKRGFRLGTVRFAWGGVGLLGETPLRTVAASSCRGTAQIAGVLSSTSPETWAFQDALEGFCSLDIMLRNWLH